MNERENPQRLFAELYHLVERKFDDRHERIGGLRSIDDVVARKFGVPAETPEVEFFARCQHLGLPDLADDPAQDEATVRTAIDEEVQGLAVRRDRGRAEEPQERKSRAWPSRTKRFSGSSPEARSGCPLPVGVCRILIFRQPRVIILCWGTRPLGSARRRRIMRPAARAAGRRGEM